MLNKPLTNYRYHPGNLYQFSKFDQKKERRKFNALEALVQELPAKLRAWNVSEDVIEMLLRGRRIEVERMRLSLNGGSPLRTFRVERLAYGTTYSKVTLRHSLFHKLVLLQSLLLPPRMFYRLRRIYAETGLAKLRGWTGSPIPAVQLVNRRPEPGSR